jgi:hypothetical protein
MQKTQIKYTPFLFLITILITSLTIGCKKNELVFSIEGTVTDQTFQSGLAGAQITIQEVPPGATNPSTTVGSATLGSDGKFSFTFTRKIAEGYRITISKPNYFTIDQTIPFSEFSTEKPITKNFETKAQAWVKVRVVNLPPAAQTDEIEYVRLQGKANCPTCFPQGNQILYGFVDSTNYYINDGNSPFELYYFATGSMNQGSKLVNTTAFDTTEIVIDF